MLVLVFAVEETLSQVIECLEESFTVPWSTSSELLRARNGAWSRDEFRRTLQEKPLVKRLEPNQLCNGDLLTEVL